MKLGNLSSEEISSRLILAAINYEENKKELEEFPFLQKESGNKRLHRCYMK